MRRWLTILLLVLLPLQFSWAAAAAYCQHERPGHARHVGHHEHAHGGAEASQQAAGDQAKTAGGKLTVDNDCGACHFSAAKSLAMESVPLPRPGAQVLSGLADQAFSSRAPDHPERPNWRIA